MICALVVAISFLVWYSTRLKNSVKFELGESVVAPLEADNQHLSLLLAEDLAAFERMAKKWERLGIVVSGDVGRDMRAMSLVVDAVCRRQQTLYQQTSQAQLGEIAARYGIDPDRQDGLYGWPDVIAMSEAMLFTALSGRICSKFDQSQERVVCR